MHGVYRGRQRALNSSAPLPVALAAVRLVSAAAYPSAVVQPCSSVVDRVGVYLVVRVSCCLACFRPLNVDRFIDPVPSSWAGRLFVWGERNEASQLGMAQEQGVYRTSYPGIEEPTPNATLAVHPYSTRTLVSVSAGTAHSAAVTDVGVVFAWG